MTNEREEMKREKNTRMKDGSKLRKSFSFNRQDKQRADGRKRRSKRPKRNKTRKRKPRESKKRH